MALAAFWLCPRAEAGLTNEDGEKIDPTPCEWVFSLENGIAQADDKRPIYIYFTREKHAKAKNLPYQFMYSPGMQRLSKKNAVFVLLAIPKKKRSDQQRALLKKYKIGKIPSAVLADRYGNLMTSASHTLTAKVSRQIAATQQAIAKIKRLLADHIKKGEAALERNNAGTAKYHFKWVVSRYPDYPEHDAAVKLLATTAEKEKAAKEKLAKARAKAAAKPEPKPESPADAPLPTEKKDPVQP